MNNFPKKQFQGTLYTFAHLAPIKLKVPLNATQTLFVDLDVEFGCHCFTEEFDAGKHRDEHKYTYKKELRAFDTLRYECSLHLPRLIEQMLKGMIYNADESYTYAAQISLESSTGPQTYSIFFSLKKDDLAKFPTLKMFVKSAYLKPPVARPNAQKWRFVSLAGQISGIFPPKERKPKPEKQKKKAP